MRPGERWAFALAVGAVFAAVASRFPPDDHDLFWHLATGRWIVEQGALARVDVFSSTAAGAALPQQQWLGDVLLWLAFAAGSWWGVVAVRSLSVLVVATLVAQLCLSRAARPWIGVVAALPALALSRIVWADRPELLGLACFAAFLGTALAARDGRREAMVALPPLMALWANVHGSFVVGAALLAALGLEVALVAREQQMGGAGEGLRPVAPPPSRRAFLAVAALAILATLLNPDGLGAYDGPGWHFANPPRFIQEWGIVDVTSPAGLLFAVTLLGTFAVAALGHGDKTRWVAILAPLGVLGLSAVRHTPLFAIAAAPYLAVALPDALERLGVRAAPARARAPIAVPSLAFVAVALAGALATAPREPDLHAFPVAAVDALRHERGTLFHEYDWGGYLIWAVPEHPVFIDGRLRPYVGAVLDDYRAAIELRPNWRDVLERRDVTLVLVRPERPLAVRLREAGWSALVQDTDLVLLRRPRRAAAQ